MRRNRLLGVRWRLHLDACPLLESVSDPIDVRTFVQGQNTQSPAGFAPLIEHFGIVPFFIKPLDQYGHFATSPAFYRTGSILALERAWKSVEYLRSKLLPSLSLLSQRLSILAETARITLSCSEGNKNDVGPLCLREKVFFFPMAIRQNKECR